MTRVLPLLTASFLALAAVSGPGAAQQNLFAPRIIINDRAVTEYEYRQRLLFMQILRAPGDLEKEAMKGLIEDRLRLQEAKRIGVKPTEAEVRKGMEEFASRANLSADEFLKVIGQAGIAPETFRDFVTAGMVWREVVRAKYGATTKVTEAEIDRALEAETRKTALTVALSELIIPAPPGQEDAAMAQARSIQGQINTEGGFASAVARYSAAASRDRGGRLAPMPLSNLPPQIASVILALGPGQVSAPITIPGGVALFQLRDVTASKEASPAMVQVEYARLRLPKTETTATDFARIRANADTCKDLYSPARGLPENQLQIETKPMSAVPADLGLELARLDPGESVLRDLGGATEMLMLCSRQPVSETPVDRSAIRNQILNRKVEAQSDLYLAELRANALIREP